MASVVHRHTIERVQILNPLSDKPTVERWAHRQAVVGDQEVGGREHIRLKDRPLDSFRSVKDLTAFADSDLVPPPQPEPSDEDDTEAAKPKK